MNLNNLKIFILVASKGSFSEAARDLNVPVSNVSRKVTDLESELGLRLLQRSTRKLKLTAVGEQLFHFASQGLSQIEMGLLELNQNQKDLKGLLRVSLPPDYNPCWELLTNFSDRFAGIELSINATPSKLDLIDDNIDITLRVGEVTNLSFVARKLWTYRHRLVCSRNFYESNGLPESIADIANFNCIAFSSTKTLKSWFIGEDSADIEPIVVSNEYRFIKQLIQQNKGIGELPPFFCNDELETGELIELFPGVSLPAQNLFLLYPSRKQVSPLARAFIEFSVEYFQNKNEL